MKFIPDGVLPKLTTFMLSALVCVACNSEPEADIDAETDPESLSEVVTPDDDEQSQADTLDPCMLDVPGAVVDLSSLDASKNLLDVFGGECQLKNTVLGSAAALRRTYVKNNHCTFEEETENDASRPPSVLGKLLVQDEEDVAESVKLQLAQSICKNESIMDWAVGAFLKDAELQVHSIGTATYADESCPAIVWSQIDNEQGQMYHVTGPGKCAEIELPNSQFFNPETNPEGQLPGDYIRQSLGYNGVLPSHYDIQGGSFQFETDKPAEQVEEVQADDMGPDRTLLGDMADRYIYWSSGDEMVDNGYLSADEALTRQYQLKEQKRMVPRGRALTALQHSYGAPRMGLVRQDVDDTQSGVHATVITSSGHRFVMLVKPSDVMNVSELLDWLPNSKPELLVLQNSNESSDDYLTLEGALFSDGSNTVRAQLDSCDCDMQGFLGWLGRDKLALNKVTEKLRKDFIARERSSSTSRDWTVSSQLGPRAVSYSLSRYGNSSRDKDAAFVIYDGGNIHSLYVKTNSECDNRLLLFSIGKNTMNLPAECRKIKGHGEDHGVVYTIPGKASKLANAIKSGSTMTVGLVEPQSKIMQEEYRFSLMGASQAMREMNADEAGYTDSAIKPYKGVKLDSEADNNILKLLQRIPNSCLSDSTAPGCVAEEASPPRMAAARPVMRARKPVRIDPDPEDFAPGYAQVITEQLGSGSQPECKAVVEQIMAVASSKGTPDARSRQIDLIVGGAPTICF